MPRAEGANLIGKVSFKLRSAISLKKLDMTTEPSAHALMQKLLPELCCQLWSYEYISFLREDINGGKGEETSEVYGVHLDNFSGLGCFGNCAPFLVLLPFRADDIFLSEYLIDFRDTEIPASGNTESFAHSTRIPFL